MKKSMLYTGIAYAAFGIACFMLAILSEWKTESLLWGFGGAGTGSGMMMLWKYFHWTNPKNREEYEKRLQKECIELRDERKIMLRDKSGRITYIFMLLLYCLLIMAFGVCASLGWFMPFARYAISGLGVLLIIQYLFGIAAFRYLSKRL